MSPRQRDRQLVHEIVAHPPKELKMAMAVHDDGRAFASNDDYLDALLAAAGRRLLGNGWRTAALRSFQGDGFGRIRSRSKGAKSSSTRRAKIRTA
jgi:hypothetical protein